MDDVSLFVWAEEVADTPVEQVDGGERNKVTAPVPAMKTLSRDDDGGTSPQTWQAVDRWELQYWVRTDAALGGAEAVAGAATGATGATGAGLPDSAPDPGSVAARPLASLWESDRPVDSAVRVNCVRRLLAIARQYPFVAPSLDTLPPRSAPLQRGEVHWLLSDGGRSGGNSGMDERDARETPGDSDRQTEGGRAVYVEFVGRFPMEGVLDTDVVLGDLPDGAHGDSPDTTNLSFHRMWDLFRGEFTFADIEVPDSLHAELRPYQQRGLSWLTLMRELGLGACLADDMGLGKTIQVIAYLLHQKERGEAGDRSGPSGPSGPSGLRDPSNQSGPSLVICPTSVVDNWRREIERFAPVLTVHIHHGPQRLRGDDMLDMLHTDRPDVVITSYGIAMRDFETLRNVSWAAIIADEAQQIKNPSAQQTRAVKRLQAQHRIALTGTPIEGYGDERATRRLRRLVRPFILRRMKEDATLALDLPQKQEEKVYCTLRWNPAVESQATDGAYRIGQTESVNVHTFVWRGTVEEHIDATIEEKRKLAGDIIESGDTWITELETDELLNIFSLRETAVRQ